MSEKEEIGMSQEGQESQQDNGAEAVSSVDVLTMRTEAETLIVNRVDEDYSGLVRTPNDTYFLFQGATEEEAVGYTKEWYLTHIDEITGETSEEEDSAFLNEVVRETGEVTEYIDLPSHLAKKKGHNGDRNITVNMSVEAQAYRTVNELFLPKLMTTDAEEVRVEYTERIPPEEPYALGYVWGKKIMQKLPLGRREVKLSLEDLREMVAEMNEIKEKHEEYAQKVAQENLKEAQERTERYLNEIKEKYPEISWNFIKDYKVLVKTENGGKTYPYGGYGLSTEDIDKIEHSTAQYQREQEEKEREKQEELAKAQAEVEDFIRSIGGDPTGIKVSFNRWGETAVEINGVLIRTTNKYPIAEALGLLPQYLQKQIDEKIAKRKEALAIAEKTGLETQMKKHREYISFYERIREVYEAGYTNRVGWDSDECNDYNIEDYDSTIPAECLQVYQKAQDSGVFDRFEIWKEIEDDDPTLIGVVEVEKKREYFELCNW